MTPTRSDLDTIAATLGVTIQYREGLQPKGAWISTRNLILLRPTLSPTQELCTLAHELGHAAHRHRSDATGWWKARQEKEADTWAARILIPLEDYIEAELLCGPHTGALARELGVTTHLIEVWQTTTKTPMPLTLDESAA